MAGNSSISYIYLAEELHELTRINRGNISAFRQSTSEVNRSDDLIKFYTRQSYKSYIGVRKIFLPSAFPSNQQLAYAISNRKSVRSFSSRELSCQSLANVIDQALSPREMLRRPYPSAGGIYAVEHYVVVTRNGEIKSGVYHYEPRGRELSLIRPFDLKEFSACINMPAEHLGDASFVILQTIVLDRHIGKYLGRGYRFSMIEVGLASQMLCLCAAANDMGALNWGGGFDADVEEQLGIDVAGEVLANIIVFGYES